MPKIAIISDVHNNEVNLKKVLDYCGREKIETIICCGDLASEETLDFLNDNFDGVIYYTFGNMDNDQLKNISFSPLQGEMSQSDREVYKKTIVFKDFGAIKLPLSPARGEMAEGQRGGSKIAFVHYPNIAKELAETGKYDFVFHGHTHKPWCSVVLTKDTLGKEKKCTILNPGNVAGEIYPPTFAVWETDTSKFELIRIHELK